MTESMKYTATKANYTLKTYVIDSNLSVDKELNGPKVLSLSQRDEDFS